jgi:hypothetical protein
VVYAVQPDPERQATERETQIATYRMVPGRDIALTQADTYTTAPVTLRASR